MQKIRVVVLGNCQIAGMKRFLRLNLLHNLEFYEVQAVHTIMDDKERQEEIADELENIDYIIMQPLTSTFGSLALNKVQKKHGDKVIVFPVMYWNVYNPELFYLKKVDGPKLNDCFADYHNMLILYGFLNDYTPEELISIFENSNLYSDQFLNEISDEGLQEIRSREKECTVICSDLIENTKGKSFFTMNHPSNSITNRVSERVLRKVGFMGEVKDLEDEGLSATQIPSCRSIANFFEFAKDEDKVVQVRNVVMTQEEMIEKFYDYYKVKEKSMLEWNIKDNIKRKTAAGRTLTQYLSSIDEDTDSKSGLWSWLKK